MAVLVIVLIGVFSLLIIGVVLWAVLSDYRERKGTLQGRRKAVSPLWSESRETKEPAAQVTDKVNSSLAAPNVTPEREAASGETEVEQTSELSALERLFEEGE